MTVALEKFVKQLTDSGILPAGKLENFVPPKASPKDAEELARELIKAGKLTQFQAQHVLLGKSKALTLGNYTILDKIGAGGMGQVFKAQHRRMDRIVAIKMLPPVMTKDAVAVARFQREVKAAAKLRHPNIVAADDADEANGVYFLVMEYVEGSDLSALVKRDGPLPISKVVNYIGQAARGLEYAHKHGVVHRDIKPANLLLNAEGTVKILDMGLARIDAGDAAATQAELTGTGAVMGTVDYMAPEQALNTKHADARADIYSLGCSLYYLLSGRAAYGGDTVMEKLLAHREQPIPSLQDVQVNVSKQVDAIFRTMVAKRVEDRYQAMGEVVAALDALGFGGSGTIAASEAATAWTLSAEERKRLATKATKKPLGSLADAVASEKSKHLLAKVVGGAFATIIAPILVAYLIKYLDQDNSAPGPPAASVGAAPLAVATGTTSQPPFPVVPGNGQQAPRLNEASTKTASTATAPPKNTAPKLPTVPAGDYALQFRGNDAVEIPSLKFDSQASYTLEGFFTAPQAAPNGRDTLTIGVDHQCQLAYTKAGHWRWVYGKTHPPPKPMAIANAPASIGRGHVACVREGHAHRLFVDGKQFRSEIAPNPAVANGLFQIGARFLGIIDEVRVSKTARYTNKDFTPAKRFEADKDTLALYHFDEGAGDVLKDSSRHGNHGQIVGAKWVRSDATTARTIDLLPLIAPQRDAVSGNWQLTADGLTVAPAGNRKTDRISRLQLPYLPPEEYDFEIDFTPTSGMLRLGQVVSAHGRAIEWEIDGKPVGHSEWSSGFSRLDGHNVAESPESLKYDQSLLNNGQRYRSRVEVRRGSLRALLDGRELRSWTGDFSRFSDVANKDQLRDPLRLGLITFLRAVTFHQITVCEVTGRGQFTDGVKPRAGSGTR